MLVTELGGQLFTDYIKSCWSVYILISVVFVMGGKNVMGETTCEQRLMKYELGESLSFLFGIWYSITERFGWERSSAVATN